MEIRDRITEFKRVRAKDLVPHELNWRIHTGEQKAALRGVLAEVGFAAALLVRPISGGRYEILDGHLRAQTLPSMELPVVVCDLNDEEANKLILTYDPISTLAEADSDRIRRLLETVHTDSQAVGALLERVAGQDAWHAAASREIIDPEPRIDEAAELAKKWGTERGQSWKIGSFAEIAAKRSLWAVCGATVGPKSAWYGLTRHMESTMRPKMRILTARTEGIVSRFPSKMTT
jgi:hypothetical protein